MIIKRAESYGFCFGVKRAIEITENNPDSTTYGPLIHNPKEINRLKEDYNVSLAEKLEDIKTDKVIIRTHGITKNDLEILTQQNKQIIDATCPFVTKPQEIVKDMSKEGYDVVIFGDKNHPEVKGVSSYVEGRCFIVLSVEELKNIKLKEKIACISQTTRKIDDFLKITDYLIRNYKEVRVFNTICNATFENQDAARKLSQEVDIMVVVGGKNSSNTKQLLNICKENCESYLVEDENELNPEWFENKKICGITAGASTPDWLIDKVENKINQIKGE